MSECSVDGCGNDVYATRWCRLHYDRVRRHGDPLVCHKPKSATGAPRAFLNDVVLPFEGEECLTWPFYRRDNGYGEIRVGRGMKHIHRVVCEMVHGAPPSSVHEAAHECGKGHEGCCNPNHLRWATPQENADDRRAHGTVASGDRLPQTKISDADAATIKLLKGAVSQQFLADQFGVSRSLIGWIQSGKRAAIKDQPVPSNFQQVGKMKVQGNA